MADSSSLRRKGETEAGTASTLHGIGYVPEEILLLVVTHVRTIIETSPSRYLWYYIFLARLLRVCSSWKNIIESAPLLWTTVFIMDTRIYSKLIDRILVNSKGAPLRFALQIPYNHRRRELVVQQLNKIMRSRRVSRMDVMAHPDEFTEIIEALCEPQPLLKSLTFHRVLMGAGPKHLPPNFLCASSSLERLKLWSLDHRTLDPVIMRNLTYLHLTLETSDSLTALKDSENLRILHIDHNRNIAASSGVYCGQSLVLPSLRRLIMFDVFRDAGQMMKNFTPLHRDGSFECSIYHSVDEDPSQADYSDEFTSFFHDVASLMSQTRLITPSVLYLRADIYPFAAKLMVMEGIYEELLCLSPVTNDTAIAWDSDTLHICNCQPPHDASSHILTINYQKSSDFSSGCVDEGWYHSFLDAFRSTMPNVRTFELSATTVRYLTQDLDGCLSKIYGVLENLDTLIFASQHQYSDQYGPALELLTENAKDCQATVLLPRLHTVLFVGLITRRDSSLLPFIFTVEAFVSERAQRGHPISSLHARDCGDLEEDLYLMAKRHPSLPVYIDGRPADEYIKHEQAPGDDYDELELNDLLS